VRLCHDSKDEWWSTGAFTVARSVECLVCIYSSCVYNSLRSAAHVNAFVNTEMAGNCQCMLSSWLLQCMTSSRRPRQSTALKPPYHVQTCVAYRRDAASSMGVKNLEDFTFKKVRRRCQNMHRACYRVRGFRSQQFDCMHQACSKR
jgi:hypothetical protein